MFLSKSLTFLAVLTVLSVNKANVEPQSQPMAKSPQVTRSEPGPVYTANSRNVLLMCEKPVGEAGQVFTLIAVSDNGQKLKIGEVPPTIFIEEKSSDKEQIFYLCDKNEKGGLQVVSFDLIYPNDYIERDAYHVYCYSENGKESISTISKENARSVFYNYFIASPKERDCLKKAMNEKGEMSNDYYVTEALYNANKFIYENDYTMIDSEGELTTKSSYGEPDYSPKKGLSPNKEKASVNIGAPKMAKANGKPTLSGRCTWQTEDINGNDVQIPLKNISVKIIYYSPLLDVTGVSMTTTDDNGYYCLDYDVPLFTTFASFIIAPRNDYCDIQFFLEDVLRFCLKNYRSEILALIGNYPAEEAYIRYYDVVNWINVFDNSSRVINFDLDKENERYNAFKITQAINMSHDFTEDIYGEDLPRLPVVYPSPFPTAFCFSWDDVDFLFHPFMSLASDRTNFDTICHEYGHYIATQLRMIGFTGEFPWIHAFNDDLVQSAYATANAAFILTQVGTSPIGSFLDAIKTVNIANNKAKQISFPLGTFLAWSEGLPNYLSVAAQMHYGNPDNIKELADPYMYKGINLSSDHYGASTNVPLGEGNELSISSSLYKWVHVNKTKIMTEQELGELLKGQKFLNFGQFVDYLYDKKPHRRELIATVLTGEKYAVEILNPYNGIRVNLFNPSSSFWKFQWELDTTSSGKSNLFDLVFEAGKKQYVISNIKTTEYSLKGDEIDNVLSLNSNVVTWYIVGRHNNDDGSKYISNKQTITFDEAAMIDEEDMSYKKTGCIASTEMCWEGIESPFAGNFDLSISSRSRVKIELFDKRVNDSSAYPPIKTGYSDLNNNFKCDLSFTKNKPLYIRLSRANVNETYISYQINLSVSKYGDFYYDGETRSFTNQGEINEHGNYSVSFANVNPANYRIIIQTDFDAYISISHGYSTAYNQDETRKVDTVLAFGSNDELTIHVTKEDWSSGKSVSITIKKTGAKMIDIGAISGSISKEKADWYCFTASSYGLYSFKTESSRNVSLTGSIYGSYDGEGHGTNKIAENGNGRNINITVFLEPQQTIFLKIERLGNYTDYADYTLHVESKDCGFFWKIKGTENAYSCADYINQNQRYNWLAFTADVSGDYEITTNGLDVFTEVFMNYPSGGSGSTSGRISCGNTNSSTITVHLEAGQTMYMRASAVDNGQTGSFTMYLLNTSYVYPD